ncbi:MAG: PEF-CTERM sorting domain-containing protein [Euryarchaeota archaeon]|nr:PEF-CTERM sorting domain-containing protein [Euryarchaeota archaeon]
MMKRTRSIILVATLLFSMVVVLTSPVLAVTNDDLDNYDSSYEDPVDTGEDMGSPAWYGTITVDTGDVRSGCKVELFKETWSPHGWWKIGENTTDSSGAYLIVLHKSMILKGHYVMRISDVSTREIYGRDIGDSQSGDWGYGVPIEEMWNCPWSQTTGSQPTGIRTMLAEVVNQAAAFVTGGRIGGDSATGETPPTDSQTTDTQTTDSQTTSIRTALTKVVNRVAAFVTGGRINSVLAASETSDGNSEINSEIPEFTTVAIPVVALLVLFMLYHRKQKK